MSGDVEKEVRMINLSHVIFSQDKICFGSAFSKTRKKIWVFAVNATVIILKHLFNPFNVIDEYIRHRTVVWLCYWWVNSWDTWCCNCYGWINLSHFLHTLSIFYKLKAIENKLKLEMGWFTERYSFPDIINTEDLMYSSLCISHIMWSTWIF